MTKYHINAKGVPAPCKAIKQPCPFGGSTGLENHFDTIEEAQEYADFKNECEFGLLPKEKEVEILKASSPAVENYLKEIDQERISIEKHQEFYDKALECDTFEIFARKYATEMVNHKSFEDSQDIADDAEKLWKEVHYQNSAKNYHELTEQEAVDIVRENMTSGQLAGWFREYDSGYKPIIENVIIINPELRNASLNIAHRVYKETVDDSVSFDDFINMEINVYRGGNFDFIDKDVFVSYSFDKKIAEGFATKDKDNLVKRKVKVRDTLGSLQTTGEAELMVRR